MIRVAAALLVASSVFAQVTATVKPISISGAQGALGSKTVGIWTVSLTSRYAAPVEVAHERITQAFPLLRDIPNRLAEDLLTRSSSTSFWAITGRYGPMVLSLAAGAYGGRAIANGNTSQALIGQAVGTVLPFLFTRAEARAPEPGVYFSDFCPDHIPLAAYGSTTCYVASGLIRGAAPMSAEIVLPGVAQ
jgi:hypothetical protein